MFKLITPSQIFDLFDFFYPLSVNRKSIDFFFCTQTHIVQADIRVIY